MTTWRDTARVGPEDVVRVRDRLFLSVGDVRRKYSAFWVLLVLAGVIASAGVVSDSTATVIGAMIVAPLMTPILGTALAIVLADRRLMGRNLGTVALAALAVVAIGYALGLLVEFPVTAATNSQVEGRVSPKLIDLLAAVATGLVGAFATMRSDVSDTLPGVAIAISLVPPLAVVGLTLESDAPHESLGALLLFGTNVAAIIATATVVMLGFGIRAAAHHVGVPIGELRGRSLVAVLGSLVLVAIPLASGSISVAREQAVVVKARPVVEQWIDEQDWELTDMELRGSTLLVSALGLRQQADLSGLKEQLNEAGLEAYDVDVTLVLGGTRDAEIEDPAEGGSDG